MNHLADYFSHTIDYSDLSIDPPSRSSSRILDGKLVIGIIALLVDFGVTLPTCLQQESRYREPSSMHCVRDMDYVLQLMAG